MFTLALFLLTFCLFILVSTFFYFTFYFTFYFLFYFICFSFIFSFFLCHFFIRKIPALNGSLLTWRKNRTKDWLNEKYLYNIHNFWAKRFFAFILKRSYLFSRLLRRGFFEFIWTSRAARACQLRRSLFALRRLDTRPELAESLCGQRNDKPFPLVFF